MQTTIARRRPARLARTLGAALDAIYATPDPLDTAEAYDRWTHRDIGAMSPAERARERDRVRLRLLLDDRPDAWLIERVTALEGGR